MLFKSNIMFSYILFMCLLLLGLSTVNTSYTIGLVVVTYVCVGKYVVVMSTVHMMFFLGYTTFIFLPALLNWYYLDIETTLFYITSFATVFFLYLTRKTTIRKFVDYGNTPKVIFLFLLFITLGLMFSKFNGLVNSIFATLIVFLSLCFRQNDFKNNILYFFMFVLLFIIYLMVCWSGFGRIVLVGWLLLVLLLFSYSLGYKVNRFVFSLLPGFGASLFASRDFSNLKFSGFKDALYDSAYSPYRLASSFIEHYNQVGPDLLGLLDQFIFTAFVFIPRAIWPSKPYGFGFEYTVRHLDAYLVEAGHSVASTLVGDHIYFLGYCGIVTSLFSLTCIAWVTNVFYKINSLNGNGVLILSASMMVLSWGGMTSFSARIVLPCIIFLLILMILKRLLKYNISLFKVR